MDSCPVRVALRVRPLSNKENSEGSVSCVSFIPNSSQIVVGSDRSFTFDYVFSPETEQETVYRSSAQPLVDKLMDGFNTTIFAYGQTGSGKTFSMGTSVDYSDAPENQGIVPRAVHNIFEIIRARHKESSHYKCEVLITFLELYNEELIDLLAPNPTPSRPSGSRPNSYHSVKGPTIREDPQGGIYWKGVTEVVVEDPNEVLDYLYKGLIGRTTASTEMNATSSRSHAIFSITIKQDIEEEEVFTNDNETEVMSENLDNAPIVKHLVSKFHFVDLAGSERLKRTQAIGGRAKEGISINAGLLALGNVISALGDETRKSSHIPYRDSKLTRLLQDSIGGNSQTLMLACISPSDSNFLETLNTLKYANRARNIKNRVQVNSGVSNPTEEINRLKNEVNKLRMQLQIHNSNSHLGIENGHTSVIKDMEQIKKLERRIIELTEEVVSIQTDRDLLILKMAKDYGVEGKELLDGVEIMNYAEEILTLRQQLEAYELAFETTIFSKKTKGRIGNTNNRLKQGDKVVNGADDYDSNLSDINGDSKALNQELDEITLNLSRLQMNNGTEDSNSDGNYNSDNPGISYRQPHSVSRVTGLRLESSNNTKSLNSSPTLTRSELGDSNELEGSKIQKLQTKIKDLQYKLNLLTREKEDLSKKLNHFNDLKGKAGGRLNRTNSEHTESLTSPEGSVKTVSDPSTFRLKEELERVIKENKMLSEQVKRLRVQSTKKARAISQLALRDTVPKKPVSSYPDFKTSQKSVSGLRSAYKRQLLEQEIQQFLLGRRARKVLFGLRKQLEKLQVEQVELMNKKEEVIKNLEDYQGDEGTEEEEKMLMLIEEISERLLEIEVEMDYTTARIKNQESIIEEKIKPPEPNEDLNPLLRDDLFGESNYRAALKILYELEPTEIYGMLELMLRDLVMLKMSQFGLKNKVNELSDSIKKKELKFESIHKTLRVITMNYERKIQELRSKADISDNEQFDPFANNLDSEFEESEVELQEQDLVI
ncbi:kinesin-domain-containing protein [Neoconidiobolus thromboides FSU 785]|nr:kinesin-domain-containing protein [Neoconidiobolus thromboides FSU 785]